MPFLNQHSARLQNPNKFDPESFRRTDSPVFGKKLPVGVEAIWAKFKGKSAENDPIIPQAIRFPEDKYTVNQAKEWLADNEIKYILFEPAKDTKEALGECWVTVGGLSVFKESKYKRDKCMEVTCDKKPLYEVLWAEGMGHCWFCESHFKDWSTKGDGKGDIVYVKECKDGKANNKFSENTNPNIWDEPGQKFKEDLKYNPDDWRIESISSLDDFQLSDRLHLIQEIWSTKKDNTNDEGIVNAYINLKTELEKRKITYTPIDEIETKQKESINRFALRTKSFKEKDLMEGCVYELLIDTGNEYIEKYTLTKNILNESEVFIDAIRFININTPDGKDFKEWLQWNGNLPEKKNGGLVYGNLTESVMEIKIIDSGSIEIAENLKDSKSIKFNGKLLKEDWIMKLGIPKSNMYILSKTGIPNEPSNKGLCEFSNFTGLNIKDGFTSMTVSYNGLDYTLNSTANGKLILTK